MCFHLCFNEGVSSIVFPLPSLFFPGRLVTENRRLVLVRSRPAWSSDYPRWREHGHGAHCAAAAAHGLLGGAMHIRAAHVGHLSGAGT